MFAHLGLVGVVGAPVVEVMAEAGHKEAEHLEVIHEPGRKKVLHYMYYPKEAV